MEGIEQEKERKEICKLILTSMFCCLCCDVIRQVDKKERDVYRKKKRKRKE